MKRLCASLKRVIIRLIVGYKFLYPESFQSGAIVVPFVKAHLAGDEFCLTFRYINIKVCSDFIHFRLCIRIEERSAINGILLIIRFPYRNILL